MTGRGQDAAGFTVLDVAPPRVAALSRSVGVPGDEVAISGERFGVDGTPGQAVTLAGNGVQVVSWTTGEVRIRVPRTADAGGPGEKALVVIGRGWSTPSPSPPGPLPGRWYSGRPSTPKAASTGMSSRGAAGLSVRPRPRPSG